MPSDFEREYKEYIESTTPDFWDKIEAGIAEETTAEVKTVTAVETSAEVESDSQSYVNQDKKVIKWGVVAKRIGQFAAVAAIAFAVYKYFTPDYLEDFDDDPDFDDDDDLFEDEDLEDSSKE